jgi:hypothetical protein
MLPGIYYSEFNFCKIKILENRVSYILFAKRSTLEIQQSQKKRVWLSDNVHNLYPTPRQNFVKFRSQEFLDPVFGVNFEFWSLIIDVFIVRRSRSSLKSGKIPL